MIIKNQTKYTRDFRKIAGGAFIAFLCASLVLVLLSFYKKGALPNSKIIIKTSFEHIEGQTFKEEENSFTDAVFQSSELFREGEHSILIKNDSLLKHGAYIVIDNPGHLYGKATVWVNVKSGNPMSGIHVKGEKTAVFHRNYVQKIETKGKWELIELSFVSPGTDIADKLVLSLKVEGKGEVYFDDFEIRLGTSYLASSSKGFIPEKINLKIEQDDYNGLKKIRDEAIVNGILMSGDDDWVSAEVIDSVQALDAKLRLKGDWIDHLKGDKWSFRVKFKKDHTWRRMGTLSFQSPEVRSLLNEWVLHKFWEREDVLTTRYDFITLEINGTPRGIYAYEEHFEKQLLEYKSRREGPIVRFGESATWAERNRAREVFDSTVVPAGVLSTELEFEKAEISAFGEGKIQKSELLTRHTEEARNLMHQYQKRLKSADEIFDLEQVAKYYAICDVMNAHHSAIWHNERFYYNPVINKLEVIGYDGNAGAINIYAAFKGERLFNDPEEDKHPGVFSNLAKDTTFINKYVHYLNKYSQEVFVDQFVKEIEPEAKARAAFLQEEFHRATFNSQAIKEKAKKIQARIWPYDDFSLIAHTERKEGEFKVLSLKNKHSIPLEILGTGISKNKMDYEFEHPEIVWAHKLGLSTAKHEQLKVPLSAKYVFCKALGLDKVIYSAINPFNSPENRSSSQEVFSNVKLDSSGIYTINGNQIFFNKGKQTITKNIVIPKGYTVFFDSGVELDFINQSAFISYSPVKMYGLETEPIKITSSDKSARGFTVLQAKEKSIISYAVFSFLDTWTYKNWVLTGAVTFYESDVDIKSSLITSNSCEDALNIIRSEFTISDLMVSNTFGDGFDADFCKGDIKDSKFVNIGNDGLDFSGSKITVESCDVKGAGDKGLSGGEESYLRIDKFVVEDAILGIASKDLSYLNVTNLSLKNCKQGFAVFRKKPEYGAGKMEVSSYETENVELLYNIEQGSILKLDGKRML